MGKKWVEVGGSRCPLKSGTLIERSLCLCLEKSPRQLHILPSEISSASWQSSFCCCCYCCWCCFSAFPAFEESVAQCFAHRIFYPTVKGSIQTTALVVIIAL